jgi:hypothetical protein
MAHNRPWTPQEDARLQAGLAADKSYSEIAKTMGRSRNALLGRAARLAEKAFPSEQARRDEVARKRASKAKERTEMRDAVIAQMRRLPRRSAILFARSAGLTYREIAMGVGLTMQRVQQIVTRPDSAPK